MCHRTTDSSVAAIITVSLVLMVAGTAKVVADVSLPAVISDNMVLQQRMKVPIWGWAAPGEKVSVDGNWQSLGALATADKEGKWLVKLETPKAGGPFEITIKGNNTITLANVLIGEVWVCSGQSNMAMAMTRVANAEQEIAAADYPNIRLFAVERQITAAQPQRDCVGSWSLCSPKVTPTFSAVAYFYGRELHAKLKVPIGIIDSSWGSTDIQAWMSMRALAEDPDFEPVIARYKMQLKDFPRMKEEHREKMAEWKQLAAQAKNEGRGVPRKPYPPRGPGELVTQTGMYNAMIAPLIPYGIRGVAWYQGEGNATRSWGYRKLFPAMIRQWRGDWGQGDFPFYYVQIAPWHKYYHAIAAELRETQLMALSVPNTGMVVTMDVPDVTDLHPKNKRDVGKRLALWAFAKTYGYKGIVYSGPLFKSMHIEGNRIRLRFDHIGGGLVAKGGELTHFMIAGEDMKFVQANAIIDGDTVVVSSKEVAKPVDVRFAWSNDAVPNFFNKAGLPASPFRTDDEPYSTIKRGY